MDHSGGGSAALIHLSCFGGFRVTAERPLGAPFLEPGGVAMLAILAAVGDAGISGEELRDLAWGELPESDGRAALGAALTALWGGGNGDSLLATGDQISFHPARVTTDVPQFEAACARGDLAAAQEIYEGPYFGGVELDVGPAYRDWLEATRQRFNDQYQAIARGTRRAAQRGLDTATPDWTAPIELVIPADAPRPRWPLAVVTIVVAIATVFTLRACGGKRADLGDAALERGDLVSARTTFAKAIAADSSNAWAWFQLARTADAQGDDSTADHAAAHADSLAESLDGAKARLVHGYGLWRSGATLHALALVDSVVQQAPELAVASAVLGEISFRSAPFIGQPRTVARVPLERAVKLLPGAVASWHRLLQLALGARDTALAEQAFDGLRGVLGARADTSYGWLRSTWAGDSIPLQEEVARAASSPPDLVLDHAMLLGLDGGRTTEALVLTDRLVTNDVPAATRVTARVLRSALYGAVDDWAHMDIEVSALSRDWPWGGAIVEAATLLAPSRTVRPAQLRALRDRLMRLGDDTTNVLRHHRYLPATSRTIRLYLLGELSARLNDARGVQAAVDSLASPKLAEPALPRRGDGYALVLQSMQLLMRGDSAAALERLGLPVALPVSAQQQLWVNGSLERRRRALLLHAAGRPGEAAGWEGGAGAFLVDLLLGPPPR